MADNTDEVPKEIPSDTPAENPSELVTPVKSKEEINPNKETENMEVHHHTHPSHGKKKLKDYFWEFLMLFLAVFCGFLAEYQLEHKIERDRAKELAKSFYYELKNDSVTAVAKVQNRKKQETALKSIASYIKDSSLIIVPKSFAINFEYGLNFRTPSIFEPKTTILDQLKNAGSLRYFKSAELQTLIGDLTVAIKNIYDRQVLESQNRLLYINPIIIRIYDYNFDAWLKKDAKSVFDVIKEYETSNEIYPFHIDEPEKIDRNNAVRVLNFYGANVISSTRIHFIEEYMEVNAALLKLLRKEYHLK